MKRIIGIIMSLAIIIGTMPMMTAMAEDAGWDGVTTTECTVGTGSTATPYEISTPEELAWARDQVNAGTLRTKAFKLTADIDMNNQEWVPMGLNDAGSFSGVFDGNGHVVKNLKITKGYTYTGFFGHVGGNGTIIKNFGLDNLNISVKGSGYIVGGMIGRGYPTLTKCFVKNSSICNDSTVESAGSSDNLNNTGGVIGGMFGSMRTTSIITDCYVYNVVLGAPSRVAVGAFWGTSENTKDATVVKNCYTAKISEKTIDGRITGTFYGFGVKNTSQDITTTAINVWSEFISRKGTRNDTSNVYYPNLVVSNDGATKEGIIAALVTTGSSYISNSQVNDGYPCLDYEKPALVTATAYAGGTGSPTDPYKIATAGQLMYARDMVNNGTHKAKSFVLTADIDLEGEEWEPMGTFWKDGASDAGNYYSGSFDGANHVIKNFKITQAYHGQIGFFGYASNATIKNLGIENASINFPSESNANVGGMIGYGAATVTNCFVKNSEILAPNLRYYQTGGFVGKTRFASTFENCYVYGCTVAAKDNSNVAGFISAVERDGNIVTNCYVANTTVGSKNQAAVYPFIVNKGKAITVENCYSDLAPATGATDKVANQYNADYAYGTYTTSKSDITGAFEDVSGFKLDNAINNGYPALSFEVAPIPYVIGAVNTNGNVKVALLENNAVEGAKVYVASYDVDGRLIGADILNATAGAQTSNVDATEASTIKVFVWGPNQMPLANMYSK